MIFRFPRSARRAMARSGAGKRPGTASQSWTRAEIRLQARMVQAAQVARREIPETGHSRGAGRRLQRRTYGARYLSDEIMEQGCVDPAEEPRRIQIARGARLA